jgi:hypothetical protein
VVVKPVKVSLRATVSVGVAVAVIVVAVGVGWVLFLRDTAVGEDVSGPLRGQLEEVVVTTLEHDPGWRLEVGHNPDLTPICAADVFAADPAGVADPGRVRSIYALVSCRWFAKEGSAAGRLVDAGLGFGDAVVVYPKSSPVYQAGTDGEGYPDSIRRLFPKRYHARILNHPDEFPDVGVKLKERIAGLNIAVPESSSS